MKRYLAPLVAYLALAGQSYAREPQAPPSPAADAVSRSVATGKGADGSSIFIGRYGETVEIPYGWTADAEMRDSVEIVYLHRKSHDDFGYKPFEPKPADYKLENFAPLGLMEFMVIPKNVPGGLRSLEEILRVKEKELTEKRVDYRVSRVTSGTHWPSGTVHVEVVRPYRLVQTYAESPKEFYILTTGGRLKEGDFGLSKDRVLDYDYADDLVSRSLGNHLLAIDKKTSRRSLFVAAPDSPDRLSARYKDVRIWAMYGAFGAAMLILAIWPGTSPRARRARVFGYSLLLFPILLAAMGFLAVFIPAHFGNLVWRHAEDATFIPMLMTPWMSWIAARRCGSAHAMRVLVSTGGLAVLWIAAITFGPRSEYPQSAGDLAFSNTVILHFIGMVCGTVFAFALGPLSQKEER